MVFLFDQAEMGFYFYNGFFYLTKLKWGLFLQWIFGFDQEFYLILDTRLKLSGLAVLAVFGSNDYKIRTAR